MLPLYGGACCWVLCYDYLLFVGGGLVVLLNCVDFVFLLRLLYMCLGSWFVLGVWYWLFGLSYLLFNVVWCMWLVTALGCLCFVVLGCLGFVAACCLVVLLVWMVVGFL